MTGPAPRGRLGGWVANRSPSSHASLVAGLACSGPATAPHDASIDDMRPDVASPLALSISVTGCAAYDPLVPLCTGPPPLALSFAPVGSQELIQFMWTFGDGTPTTTERAPSHSYAHLGEYEVTVKGGTADMGTVKPPAPLIVRVEALATGAPCDVDDAVRQRPDLRLRERKRLPARRSRMACARHPRGGRLSKPARCASASSSARRRTPARQPPCASHPARRDRAGRASPAGRCRSARRTPRRPPAGHVVLPLGLVGDVGASCRDANEALSDGACATGSCADIGALGVCSASCDDSHPCPAARRARASPTAGSSA